MWNPTPQKKLLVDNELKKISRIIFNIDILIT